MHLLDSGLLLRWALQRLMGQVLKHKKAELKVTWIFEVSNTAIHWGILSEQVLETEKAVLAKHGVGSTSWFPLLSSKSPCATSTYPYYLQRSGWLGPFAYFSWRMGTTVAVLDSALLMKLRFYEYQAESWAVTPAFQCRIPMCPQCPLVIVLQQSWAMGLSIPFGVLRSASRLLWCCMIYDTRDEWIVYFI